MPRPSFHALIGLAGIDANETSAARRSAKLFEIPTLLIALWIIVAWYWQGRGQVSVAHTELLDICIWGFFILETSVTSYLCRNRGLYLRGNWLNLVIIVGGIPVIWDTIPYTMNLPALRLLIFINLMLQLSGGLKQILSRNHLGTTLLVCLFVIIIAGYLMAGIDPAIDTPLDGVWWAWVTVTTVGYGDIVPSTNQGRFFAGLLMVLGIGIFSMITAGFSVFFIEQKQEEEEKKRRKLDEFEQRMIRIEQQLISLNKKLDRDS